MKTVISIAAVAALLACGVVLAECAREPNRFAAIGTDNAGTLWRR